MPDQDQRARLCARLQDMVDQPSTSAIRRFGVFQADVGDGTLHRKGIPVRLAEQPFRLLALLLERPGQLVGREEIRLALWPNGTFVDFESGLNSAMKKLRAVLDDDPANPRFIETVPKRGYRFIAPVETVANAEAGAAPGDSTPHRNVPSQADFHQAAQSKTLPPTPSNPKRRWFHAVIPVAAFLVAWQVVYWAFPLPPPRIIGRTRLTATGHADLTVLTDGSRVIFNTRKGPRYDLMQTSVNGGEILPLPSPFQNSAMMMDIAPDHANFLVGTFDRRADAMELWIWPVQGGAPRRLGDFYASAGSWSPDGGHVAFCHHGSLFTVKSDGSGVKEIVHLPGILHSPVWSPDGISLRITLLDEALGTNSIWQVNADASRLHRFNPKGIDNSDLWNAGWAGPNYFLFFSGELPHQSLWAIREKGSFWRRSSSSPVRLTSGPDDPIFFVRPDAQRNILFSLASWPNFKLLAFSPRHSQTKLFSLNRNAYNAHFSRDGRWVAFVTGNDNVLWRCRADGGDCLRLTSPPFVPIEPRWSPDSQQVLFLDTRTGVVRHVYSVYADGSSQPRILGPPNLQAGIADWSADGKQIVLDLAEARPDAGNNLYTMDIDSGKLVALPESKGFIGAAWSPDGRFIAAIDASQHKVLLFDTSKRQWKLVAQGDHITYIYWSRISRNFYYQDSGKYSQPVFEANPDTGKSKLYMDFSALLESEALTCRLNGIGLDDTLYVSAINGAVDIFALKLDLP